METRFAVPALLLISFAIVLSGCAQDPTATVDVYVYDADNSPVDGANVSAYSNYNLGTGTEKFTRLDGTITATGITKNGKTTLNILPGNYAFKASKGTTTGGEEKLIITANNYVNITISTTQSIAEEECKGGDAEACPGENPACYNGKCTTTCVSPNSDCQYNGQDGICTQTEEGKVCVFGVDTAGTSDCTDDEKEPIAYDRGTINYFKSNGEEVEATDTCNGNRLTEYYCQDGKAYEQIISCANGCENGACIGGIQQELKTAKILELPIPEKIGCLGKGEKAPGCEEFFEGSSLVCPKFLNPVYDSVGKFYPSACWAEKFGVMDYKYGYSEEMKQFFRDLWATNSGYTDKAGATHKSNVIVNSPEIEFDYSGSGLSGIKSGTSFRSVLWKNNKEYSILDFEIDISYGATPDGKEDNPKKMTPTLFSNQATAKPVFGEKYNILLAFVMFDGAYPEQVLADWTKKYEFYLNDYIAKKQKVPNPIKYKIISVMIQPPTGVEKPSTAHLSFTEDEMQKIYGAVTGKTQERNFDVFTVAPVFLEGFGGYYTTWNGMMLIVAPLHPNEPYSAEDKRKGLDSLAAFQQMFLTLSHEILHAVGLAGDHIPMAQGTTYLETVGQDVDKVTGKPAQGKSFCDFLGKSPDYYAVELPDNLKIFAGKEPEWLSKTQSASGLCLTGLYNNDILKDYDKDGEYEIMYKNNLIGIELQRALGWADVDSDGIAELVDTTPYGGYKIVDEKFTLGSNMEGINTNYSFEPLGQETISGCSFEKVKLENGKIGKAPMQCEEFNNLIVNLYKKAKYKWLKIETQKYGNVLVPFI